MNDLKSDIINGAFSKLRISGITVKPSPEELILGLRRLEGLALELYHKNIYTGYNFEDEPDLNSMSGITPDLWYAFESLLAVRLISDFGKGERLDPMLLNSAGQQMSYLTKLSVENNTRQVNFPSNHPRGSGNTRFSLSNRYYSGGISVIINSSKVLNSGDINDFSERFDAYLRNDESISTYTIEADSNLTIQSHSLSGNSILYRLKAEKYSDGTSKVKIVIDTTLGRKLTKIIEYAILNEVEIE